MSSESKTPAVAVLPAGGAPAPGSAADAVERTLFEAGLPLPARPVNGFMRHHLATHIMPQAVVPISRGITIRPRMLAENLRAGSFPDEVQSIATSFKMRLADQTMDQVAEMEDINRSHNSTAHERSVVVAVKKIPHNSGSLIPWGFLQRGATLLGSEAWLVARVDSSGPATAPEPPLPPLPGTVDATSYRVNYYADGGEDFFYTDVVPATPALGTWLDYAWFKARLAKERFFPSRDPAAEQPNEVVLPQPPPRTPPASGAA